MIDLLRSSEVWTAIYKGILFTSFKTWTLYKVMFYSPGLQSSPKNSSSHLGIHFVFTIIQLTPSSEFEGHPLVPRGSKTRAFACCSTITNTHP